MNFLATTYGLLLVLTLFSFAQLSQFKQTSLLHATYEKNAEKDYSDLRETLLKKAKEHFKDVKEPSKKEKNEDTDSDDEETDNRTRFVHISPLFTSDTNIHANARPRTCYTVLKNLIEELFGKAEFFQSAKKNYSNLTEDFLEHVIDRTQEYKKKNERIFPEQLKNLGKIELENEDFQYLRYKMLQGSKPRPKNKKDITKDGYYALSDFVKLTKHRFVASVYAAAPVVLQALFQNPEVVQEVIEKRREIFRTLKSKKKSEITKEVLESEFEKAFKPLLTDGIDAQFIDFAVSKTEPKDF